VIHSGLLSVCECVLKLGILKMDLLYQINEIIKMYVLFEHFNPSITVKRGNCMYYLFKANRGYCLSQNIYFTF